MAKVKSKAPPVVSEPRYVGVWIETETYDIIASAAYKSGDKVSKWIRNILAEGANKINSKNI